MSSCHIAVPASFGPPALESKALTVTVVGIIVVSGTGSVSSVIVTLNVYVPAAGVGEKTREKSPVFGRETGIRSVVFGEVKVVPATFQEST